MGPCMCGDCDKDARLREKHDRWRAVFATLNEHQARLFAASQAIDLGTDGPTLMARITGLSPRTIQRGMQELRQGVFPLGSERARRCGGGRPKCEEADPELIEALEVIMDENTAGDPMSLLRWTSKSTRTIAATLKQQGHPVSHPTILRLLHEQHYSLRGNVKSLEGKQHPDRDAQFRYLRDQAKAFLDAQQPVISVDTKKKEKVGEFKNPGWQWGRQDVMVNTYDFSSLSEGPAIPYGVYDELHNEGFVSVGMSHDTAEFAVESIQRWWQWMGRHNYPQAKELLITADNGGSNASVARLWRVCLQRFADQSGLDVTVCHYPTGTSKWNKVEHRLFSFISINWRGKPLSTYETVVNLISRTTTETGLWVHADLDYEVYETGIKVSDATMMGLLIEPHSVHPKWNYTIRHHP
jgi:Rhodopirellula transposase DDE domain